MQVTIKIKLTKDEVSAFRSHFGEHSQSGDVKDAILAEIDAYFNDLEETAHERSLGKHLPIYDTETGTLKDVRQKYGREIVYLDNVQTTVTELLDAQTHAPHAKNAMAAALASLNWKKFPSAIQWIAVGPPERQKILSFAPEPLGAPPRPRWLRR
tara:strand:- start:45 stop:509 length:465 start_codon:yes stop_codon:yes gene_type:complete